MFKLMIHGGAGAILDPQRYEDSLRAIITSGREMMLSGASALDTVTHCVTLLEDDPLFNAGHGGVLTHDGVVECDASIMRGDGMDAGAIAGVKGVKNPIKLARRVMEDSKFVFLIGSGAEEFAREHGAEFEDMSYFITPDRVKQLEQALKDDKTTLDHAEDMDKDDMGSGVEEKKLGTVGAIAIDSNGNLAAATSTGGIVNKRYGRVGDSSVVGAGTFAEDGVAAVSCTGYGEQFLRTALAGTAASFVRAGSSAQEAADKAIRYLEEKVDGLGGLILIDKDYNMARSYNTPGLLSAKADDQGVKVYIK